MKILHVVPSLGADQGGIRSAVIGTVRAMVLSGMSAEVACVGVPEPEAVGVPVHAFAPSSPRLTRASAGLRKWLAANVGHYDAVIVHTIWLSPTRYAVDAARAAGVPAWLLPHGMLDPDALAHHAWRKRLRWLAGESRRIKSCTLVFSTLADAARARTTPAVHDLPHVVIPNAVASEVLSPDRSKGGVPRILCLNRIHPRKGVLELARALSLLHRQGAKFLAEFAGGVGDTAYAGRARRECRALEDLGVVRWLGVLDASAVQQRLQLADILVHPATGFENFGMVIAEAACAGLCILASPRALLAPEMARAGALLACEPEPQALAASLADLLRDPLRQESLARNALLYARKFEPQRVAEAWLRAFANACVGRSKV